MMGGVRLGKFKRKSKKATNCDCPAWADYKNKSESILQRRPEPNDYDLQNPDTGVHLQDKKTRMEHRRL